MPRVEWAREPSVAESPGGGAGVWVCAGLAAVLDMVWLREVLHPVRGAAEDALDIAGNAAASIAARKAAGIVARTIWSAASAGVIPLILSACPKLLGVNFENLEIASFRSPFTRA